MKWQKTQKTRERRQEKKDHIAKAFAGDREVEVIPAKEKDPSQKNAVQRVAAYCRVSTYEESQAGSFELQVQHYREMIARNPMWEMVDIYSDEGISGTSMARRVGFQRMIEDCQLGKIDLIVTKSVSRFSRNLLDCVEVIRRLKALDPPVGVFFENEGLNTAESKNEFTLGVMSLVAQGESEAKSAAITWSIMQRFEKGIPIIPTHNLLGFDKDPYGKVIIVEEEAFIIRFIYESYVNGSNAREIAAALNDARIPTVTGKSEWKSSGIYRILRNEKYCGDVLMQKTFTVDCFTHKKKRNTGQRPQYRLRNAIPAIIPRKRWEKVQEYLKQRRYSSRAVEKPETGIYISRVKTGALRGFININQHWRKKDIDEVLKKLLENEKGE